MWKLKNKNLKENQKTIYTQSRHALLAYRTLEAGGGTQLKRLDSGHDDHVLRQSLGLDHGQRIEAGKETVSRSMTESRSEPWTKLGLNQRYKVI